MVKLPKRVTACVLIEPNFLHFQSLLKLPSSADFLLYGKCVIRTPTMLLLAESPSFLLMISAEFLLSKSFISSILGRLCFFSVCFTKGWTSCAVLATSRSLFINTPQNIYPPMHLCLPNGCLR